jgi:Spy/CpxP family protein refolding chaperone
MKKRRMFFGAFWMACISALLAMTPAAATQGTHRGQFYTKADVERIIKRVEERSDAFRRVVDRSLDRSVLNGTNREDNINQQVKELENAIDKLRKDFDRAQTWEETRSQVQQVMNEADEVNAIVRRGRWRRGGPVKSEWALVRNDLNRLAGVYNLRLLVP